MATSSIPRPERLPTTLPHVLHGGRYAILSKLGKGAYGEVYVAQSQVSKRIVAIKVERTDAIYPQLEFETNVLMYLAEHGCSDIIPCVSCFGATENEIWRYTVMDKLGDNLLALLTRNGGRFSAYTSIRVAYEMVRILRCVHAAYIMHRDIKPENFCINYDDPSKIRIIDFGMSKAYFDTDTDQHIPQQYDHPFMGTPRYVSVNAHKKYQLSRRDDLISVGYVCAYFFAGTLPWRRLEEELSTSAGRNHPMRVYDRICAMKQNYPGARIHEELHVPRSICDIIDAGYALRFDQDPDYDDIESKLLSELAEYTSSQFDWQNEDAEPRPRPATRTRRTR